MMQRIPIRVRLMNGSHVDSLPPCGGEMGWGSCRGAPKCHISRPHPRPLPTRGGEESVASSLNLTPMRGYPTDADFLSNHRKCGPQVSAPLADRQEEGAS